MYCPTCSIPGRWLPNERNSPNCTCNSSFLPLCDHFFMPVVRKLCIHVSVTLKLLVHDRRMCRGSERTGACVSEASSDGLAKKYGLRSVPGIIWQGSRNMQRPFALGLCSVSKISRLHAHLISTLNASRGSRDCAGCVSALFES